MATRGSGLFGPRAFYKSALAIAVPIMLQQLIQSMVSLVDNFMVSGLGDVCMSGVNVAGQMLFVFMVFINAICMSGGIFMTQFFGAKDPAGMGQAFRFKLAAGLAAFIPYFLVTLVFPRQVLSLMLARMQRTGGAVLITAKLTTRIADIVLRMQKMGIRVRFIWITDAPRSESLEMLERLKMAGAEIRRVDPWSAAAEAPVPENGELFNT
jgi:Na+-driven multidrug efflux pump